MRILFKIIILACSISIAKSADVQVTNNTTIAVSTNVFCTLSIDPINSWNAWPSPICSVRLCNSTDSKLSGLQLSAEKLFDVNLVDTNGQFVKKTEYGKQFGQALTQKQLNDWVIPIRITGHISAGWFFVPFGPGAQHWVDVGNFSIPKVFELTHAGEYTLHMRMRLIQSCISDQSGMIRTNILDAQQLGAGRKMPTIFQSIWLPEVTAKVQIPPEDILPENLSPSSQTNSPIK